MAEQTLNRDMSDEPDRQELEDRVDQLESTISKMLPSRRDALKLGGAALVGGAAMSGSASAGTQQAGTIGTATDPVDVESEDINNADTVTTQDLVVNGTATGPFGGGVVLESGQSVTIQTINQNQTDQSFVNLYSGGAKDVLGGSVMGPQQTDFLYEFADNQTFTQGQGVGGTSYGGLDHRGGDTNSDNMEHLTLPPAKDVIRVEVGARLFGNFFGASIMLKD